MKILLYADNHFCERSSIINKFGTKFTVRLENQIKSINWAENLAFEKGCQYVICLGDFFDKPSLTQDELTALRDIEWAPAAHYFLVGNHESEEADLHYSSTKALEGRDRFVISEPTLLKEPGFELAFLPYIVESNKKPVGEYFPELGETPRILISHNDLLGIQMGPAVSTIGFDPEELGKYCTCCFNGHLHNGQKITNKVLNLGNLTGKDFGEDAYKYAHQVAILDTETFKVDFIENPYAFNFYKLEITDEEYLVKNDLRKLLQLKDNAVIQVKCSHKIAGDIREAISALKNIIESRIIVVYENTSGETAEDITDLTVDQYVKFAECCREKLENSEILEQELAEILK